MSAEMNCPVVLLNGQKFTLLKVMLYDEDGVQEVAKLRAQAARSLGGGGSLGVGVFGSPSWTLLGEAAAISIISGLLSSASQKQAVEMLPKNFPLCRFGSPHCATRSAITEANYQLHDCQKS
jgi:hypothetical protein